MHHQGRKHYIECLIGKGELLDHSDLERDRHVVPRRFGARTGNLRCSRVNSNNAAQATHAALYVHG